ncbi:hypothetical protein TH4_18455 [Thalassospira tepidiphila MCCC 1A03514]|uniref:Holin n=2 Tax=Thalassospira tepidiphila TaxID=393657 RepID=A0A853KW13_9PROT|nr:hypothetical protein TH4_18455 [Thalassospira tepidiphila MCCC 1A03514]
MRAAMGSSMIDKIKAAAPAVGGAGGFFAQFTNWEPAMKLVIGALTIMWLLMQMYYKWRNNRRQDKGAAQ